MKKFLLIILSMLLALMLVSCSQQISEEEAREREDRLTQEKLDEEIRTVREFYKYQKLLDECMLSLFTMYSSVPIDDALKAFVKVYVGDERQAIGKGDLKISDYEDGKWRIGISDDVATYFSGISFKSEYRVFSKESGEELDYIKDEKFTIKNGVHHCLENSGEKTVSVKAELNGREYSVEFKCSERNGYSKALVNGKAVNISLLNMGLAEKESSSYYEYEKKK